MGMSRAQAHRNDRHVFFCGDGRTGYVQEHVNIGSDPPGSKSLLLINMDGVDQADLISHAKAQAWFIDSFEEWRKAKNLSNFILLGHSFGGYVAAKYALKHPQHVQHLILVGSAGFSSESDAKSEWITRFSTTWKGTVLNHLRESNFTPQKLVRGLGPWGPNIVPKYTSTRFGTHSTGEILTEEESALLIDIWDKYDVYHTLAAKATGELCLKYIFSFGAFARMPLLLRLDELSRCPRSSQAYEGSMRNHQGSSGWALCVLDNPTAFHSAVFYACGRFLTPDPDNESLPQRANLCIG
ncbi:1-acylglycerol-3-phosphate O-acyltransferase [Glycine soja]